MRQMETVIKEQYVFICCLRLFENFTKYFIKIFIVFE